MITSMYKSYVASFIYFIILVSPNINYSIKVWWWTWICRCDVCSI